MSQKRVTIVIGTRPEAIKLAPVIRRFRNSKIFETSVVLTGQHKQLALDVIKLFQIKIDLNLEIMKKSQSLEEITVSILNGISNEFKKFPSDLVIVQGDTTTAFASSLAAFYQKIPVAHVDAGLRTDSIKEPFPEEANRRFISQIAELNFAPTDNAKNNLLKSGITGEIHVTGNTVVDALCQISEKLRGNLKLNNLDDKKKINTFNRSSERELGRKSSKSDKSN